MPSGAESATVLRRGSAVDPVDRFLAHLTAIDRSPNTVRAYAHDLRDYFDFLEGRGLQWDRVGLEDLGRFVSWLRLPDKARDGRVAALPWVDPDVCAATVNRKLSALTSFYEFHQRHGVELGEVADALAPGSARRLMEAVSCPAWRTPGAPPCDCAARRAAPAAGAEPGGDGYID